jgi:predicted transcriptional regulator
MSSQTPLDDVAFLARSGHRVAVLRALAAGPLFRPALHEETGVPQPTLGRILGAFETRGWVTRDGRAYALTAWGRLVVEGFEELTEAVAATQTVGDLLGDLPPDVLDVDLRAFADATVTTPTEGDVLGHVRRAERLLAGGTRIRLVANTLVASSLAGLHDRVVESDDPDFHFETVITGAALDRALADSTFADWVAALVGSGHAPLYRYEGTVPLTVGVVDEIALLGPLDDEGLPTALVESHDPAVREWAETTYERYRTNSTEVTAADLGG